jgi:hypothetical protein
MPGPRQVAATAVERSLDRLVQRLCEAGGTNVLGIALYGGLAKGRHTPGISDVNVIVVIADARLAAMLPLAPSLTAALRQSQVVAFVVTPAELREAARLFPLKILEIQAHHRLLHGDIHVGDLQVDPESLQLRIFQDLKGLELRLRQRILEHGGEAEALWQGLVHSLPKLAATLETVLRWRGGVVPPDRSELLRLAAVALGIEPDRLARLATLRRGAERPSDESVRDLLDDYLTLLADLRARLAAPGGG